MRRNSLWRLYRKTMRLRREPALWIVAITALGLLVGLLAPTDALAADTAESIHAKAFTVGRDIAFNRGQYAPQSPGGQPKTLPNASRKPLCDS